MKSLDWWTWGVKTTRSLNHLYGNYTLLLSASDAGHPSKSTVATVCVSVTDFNDNAPVFVSPNQNVTIRIPEVRVVVARLGVKRPFL